MDVFVKQKVSAGNYKKLSFSLPSKESEVLDIHFVQYFRPKGMVEESPEWIKNADNIIQILAYDHKNSVLVVATWDVFNDKEVSMHQILSEEKYPESLFLQGIVNKKTVQKGQSLL